MKIHIVRTQINASKLSARLFPLIFEEETGKAVSYEDIDRNEYGKPLSVNGFHFNISHSGEFWCIVFSSFSCGIDIEIPRYVHSRLARKILGVNEEVMNDDLLHNWVVKEAYSKMIGKGIGLDFTKIDLDTISRDFCIENLCSDEFICYAIGQELVSEVVNWDFDDNEVINQKSVKS